MIFERHLNGGNTQSEMDDVVNLMVAVAVAVAIAIALQATDTMPVVVVMVVMVMMMAVRNDASCRGEEDGGSLNELHVLMSVQDIW